MCWSTSNYTLIIQHHVTSSGSSAGAGTWSKVAHLLPLSHRLVLHEEPCLSPQGASLYPHLQPLQLIRNPLLARSAALTVQQVMLRCIAPITPFGVPELLQLSASPDVRPRGFLLHFHLRRLLPLLLRGQLNHHILLWGCGVGLSGQGNPITMPNSSLTHCSSAGLVIVSHPPPFQPSEDPSPSKRPAGT